MSLSISMILGLLAATLLLAQGVATLRQPNLPQPDEAQAVGTAQQPKVSTADIWLGWLTILIAALGLLAQLLFYTGVLVLTPRFGNVIVQGYPALVALNVLMVGISMSAGLWLSAVRIRVGWPQHKRLWVTLGLLVGVSTWFQILRLLDLENRPGVPLGVQVLHALQMLPLNPSDPSPLHAFAYDLRWPPLLAWLAYCMIESLLALVLFFRHKDKEVCNSVEYRDLRGWVGGLAIALQGVWALNQPVVSPRSVLLWKLIVLLAITYNTVKLFEVVIWRAEIRSALWAAQTPLLKQVAEWVRQKRILLGLFVGLCLVMYVLLFSWIDTQPQWRAIAITVGIILVVSIWLPRRHGSWMHSKLAERCQAIVTGGASEYRLTIPLLALAASLIGLFYDFYGISIGIPLACFFIACVAFNDIAVEHGLRYQLEKATQQGGTLNQLLHRRSALRIRLRRTRGGVGGIAKRLTAWFSNLLDLRTAALALVKLLIAIIVLLAISEFVNAGKTIVQPFTIAGLAESGSALKADDDSAGLAQAISDRLVGNLGGLGQMLQPDTIILSPGVRGGVKIQFVNAGPNAGSVDAVLAQNNELDIGGVKAPANLFVAPIRDPVRLALNVRTISGRIQDNGDSYTLLAISNKGETWISKYPHHDLSQAVISGTEELAFDILSSDPTFAAFGMTRSWQAFQRFRDGLNDWEAFEQTQEGGRLTAAIDHFQQAIDADHSFALAFYRLGIAQQRDGRPDSAIGSFRSSIAADSKFVPAYNALAYTLYNFVEYDGNARSATLPLVAPSGEQARADEARRHWQQIVLFPIDAVAPYERASAYYGLCLDAADQNLYQLAYFYCQRAESMYGQLSSALRADLRVKQAEAAVLNTLGVAVMRLRLPQVSASQINSAPEVAHSCLAVELNDANRAPRPSLTAQRYFEQALSLQPDDPNIRCNLAGADFVSGNRERAQALDADAGTLRSLAESYRILAKKYFFQSLASDDLAQAADQEDIEERYRKNAEAQRASALTYYRMALEGYQRVLDHDPLDQQALLGYAYTIWQWRFEQLHTLPIEGPLPAEAHNGLSYARRAAELTDASPSSPIKGLAHARFGAVLLGQLEVAYAARELEIALDQISQDDSANDENKSMLVDETKWMLAQAYLCQGGHNDRASGLLSEIADSEKGHSSKPFTESQFLNTLLSGSDPQPDLLRCTLDGA
jgi:tetratricopeptide (TPR) repeat protein